jgi:hypothetical protein
MSIPAVRALLVRVMLLEATTSKHLTDLLAWEDPEWLQLPPAKREVALSRYQALVAYDGLTSPSKADAEKAAQGLGLKLRTFYALLRDWRDDNRSPLALVPYRSGEPGARPSRLDAKVAAKLNELVRRVLDDNSSIKPGQAVRKVRENWPDGLSPPSDVTIRKYIDRQQSERPSRPGSLRLNLGEGPQEEAETATRFGEVVVVDHTAPARILVGDAATARSPVITLAIDLWSGAPIGSSVSDGEPDPDAIMDALTDAFGRMAVLAPETHPIRPRIVYASSHGEGWDRLRRELLSARISLTERPDHRLHFGGPTRRLVGNRLGSMQLQPSKARRAGLVEIDPEQDALLALDQVQQIVDAAVDELIQARVPEIAGVRGNRLELTDLLGSDRTGGRELATYLGSLESPLVRRHLKAYSGRGLPTDGAVETDSAHGTIEDEITDLVDEIAGDNLVDLRITRSSRDGNVWLVDVLVDSQEVAPEIWIELAREALDMAECSEALVQFTVIGLDADLEALIQLLQDSRGARPRLGEPPIVPRLPSSAEPGDDGILPRVLRDMHLER